MEVKTNIIILSTTKAKFNTEILKILEQRELNREYETPCI